MTEPEAQAPPAGAMIGPWRILERVGGGTFGIVYWAKQRAITSRHALGVLAQVARALEATHRHGVHRDVKGDNVLVTSEGDAVLVDFGCCWFAGARELTVGRLPPGTRPYRSPQALRHEREGEPGARYSGTPADDVYALGVMAYHLVTGTYPPQGTEDAPRLLAPSELATIAPELEALILRMLAESPEARGTAGELAEALERAERSAGPVADVQVRPSRSMLPTERATRPGPTRWHMARQTLRRHSKRLAVVAGTLAASVVAGALLSLLLGSGSDERPKPVATVEEQEKEEAAAEERAVGLADGGVDEFLAAAETQPSHGVPGVIGRSLPKTPAPGQRKPPCEPERQKAINGLCWWMLSWKPPCGDGYEHEDRCYVPVVLKARPPTTEEP